MAVNQEGDTYGGYWDKWADRLTSFSFKVGVALAIGSFSLVTYGVLLAKYLS